MSEVLHPAPAPAGVGSTGAAITGRTIQLIACTIAIMAVAGPQYVWTPFVAPIRHGLGAGLSAVQVTFSLLIVVQCALGPMHGWLADRFGPRFMVGVGAALVGLSWISSAYAPTLFLLYLTYGVIGGLGIGIVCVTTVALIGKWFPHRRGFAMGTVAAGYGVGAIVTTGPISSCIAAYGYRFTLILFGALSMAACGLAAQFLRRAPTDIAQPAPAARLGSPSQGPDVSWRRMLQTPVYWLMFAMLVMMSAGGLMAVSQIGPLSEDFGLAHATVLGMAALPLALSFDRVCNGLTRPAFGWLSDRIGREQTMTLAFTLEAMAILILLRFGGNPMTFVLMSGVVFFAWGEIFSLFPAMQSDLFGASQASLKYGFLLMAQGLGSVLGAPLAVLLREHSANWTPGFQIAVGLDLLTAALAWFVLGPMRRRYLARATAAA